MLFCLTTHKGAFAIGTELECRMSDNSLSYGSVILGARVGRFHICTQPSSDEINCEKAVSISERLRMEISGFDQQHCSYIGSNLAVVHEGANNYTVKFREVESHEFSSLKLICQQTYSCR